MGVKGLTSYVNDKKGYQHVSLSSILQRSPGKSRKIIIDGSSLLFFLISPSQLFPPIDNAHGGQYLQFSFNVAAFVRFFRDKEIELIVYFDGIVESIKEETIIDRHIQKCASITEFLSGPDELRTEQAARAASLVPVPIYFEVLENILPKLGVCCRRAIFEADPAVAKAFFDENALAVFAEDSDYMAFGVDYIPFASLTWDKESSEMSGNFYSAQSVSKVLGLAPQHLPLLGSLVGNDFVSVKDLRKFHSFVAKNAFSSADIIESVARFISERDGDIRLTDLFLESSPKPLLESIARYRLSPHSSLAENEKECLEWLKSENLIDLWNNFKLPSFIINVACLKRFVVTTSCFIGRHDRHKRVTDSLRGIRAFIYAYSCSYATTRKPSAIDEIAVHDEVYRTNVQVPQLDYVELEQPLVSSDPRMQKWAFLTAVLDGIGQAELEAPLKALKSVQSVVGNANFLLLCAVITAVRSDSYSAVGIPADELVIYIETFLMSLLLKNVLSLDELSCIEVPQAFSASKYRFLSITFLSFKSVCQLHDSVGAPYELELGDLFNGRLFHGLLHKVLTSANRQDVIQASTVAVGYQAGRVMKTLHSCCEIKRVQPLVDAKAQKNSRAQKSCMDLEALWMHTILHRDKTISVSIPTVKTKDPVLDRNRPLEMKEPRWGNIRPNAIVEPMLSYLQLDDRSFVVPSPSATSSRGMNERSRAEAARLRAYAREIAPGGDSVFKLDDFQQSAADAINKGDSVLVCAPTGAGKTEVAMLAIERTLRSKTSGRVIYVSPTKALVHQIFVEILNRFPTSDREDPVVGLMTADFQIDVTSRVLITVPELMKQILLSDDKKFLNQINCMILDEFHFIQEASRGGEWESIILLLPPRVSIVALSATIDQPEVFVEWINQRRRLGPSASVMQLIMPASFQRPIPLRYHCIMSKDTLRPVHPLLFSQNPAVGSLTLQDMNDLRMAMDPPLDPSQKEDQAPEQFLCSFCRERFLGKEHFLLHLRRTLHGVVAQNADMVEVLESAPTAPGHYQETGGSEDEEFEPSFPSEEQQAEQLAAEEIHDMGGSPSPPREDLDFDPTEEIPANNADPFAVPAGPIAEIISTLESSPEAIYTCYDRIMHKQLYLETGIVRWFADAVSRDVQRNLLPGIVLNVVLRMIDDSASLLVQDAVYMLIRFTEAKVRLKSTAKLASCIFTRMKELESPAEKARVITAVSVWVFNSAYAAQFRTWMRTAIATLADSVEVSDVFIVVFEAYLGILVRDVCPTICMDLLLELDSFLEIAKSRKDWHHLFQNPKARQMYSRLYEALKPPSLDQLVLDAPKYGSDSIMEVPTNVTISGYRREEQASMSSQSLQQPDGGTFATHQPEASKFSEVGGVGEATFSAVPKSPTNSIGSKPAAAMTPAQFFRFCRRQSEESFDEIGLRHHWELVPEKDQVWSQQRFHVMLRGSLSLALKWSKFWIEELWKLNKTPQVQKDLKEVLELILECVAAPRTRYYFRSSFSTLGNIFKSSFVWSEDCVHLVRSILGDPEWNDRSKILFAGCLATSIQAEFASVAPLLQGELQIFVPSDATSAAEASATVHQIVRFLSGAPSNEEVDSLCGVIGHHIPQYIALDILIEMQTSPNAIPACCLQILDKRLYTHPGIVRWVADAVAGKKKAKSIPRKLRDVVAVMARNADQIPPPDAAYLLMRCSSSKCLHKQAADLAFTLLQHIPELRSTKHMPLIIVKASRQFSTSSDTTIFQACIKTAVESLRSPNEVSEVFRAVLREYSSQPKSFGDCPRFCIDVLITSESFLHIAKEQLEWRELYCTKKARRAFGPLWSALRALAPDAFPENVANTPSKAVGKKQKTPAKRLDSIQSPETNSGSPEQSTISTSTASLSHANAEVRPSNLLQKVQNRTLEAEDVYLIMESITEVSVETDQTVRAILRFIAASIEDGVDKFAIASRHLFAVCLRSELNTGTFEFSLPLSKSLISFSQKLEVLFDIVNSHANSILDFYDAITFGMNPTLICDLLSLLVEKMVYAPSCHKSIPQILSLLQPGADIIAEGDKTVWSRIMGSIDALSLPEYALSALKSFWGEVVGASNPDPEIVTGEINKFRSLHPEDQQATLQKLHRLQGHGELVSIQRTLRLLMMRDLLPAICFILERSACEKEFLNCNESPLSLDAPERAKLQTALEDYKKLEDPVVVSLEKPFQENFLNGIGIHHAGMSRGWRTMTERMFRARMLKIIVATSTLAVGIHMPCRTVVFPNMSFYLDAMSFHQMSGRAGRRGFDSIGNVVFANFDYARIKQLVSHNTVPLSCLQRVDATSILQLLHLTRWDPERASNAVLRTLHNFVGGTDSLVQIRNSYLLSLRLFAKLGLATFVPSGIQCTALSAGATKLSQYAPVQLHLLKILLCDAMDESQPPMLDDELLLLLSLCVYGPRSGPRPLRLKNASLPGLPAKIVSLVDYMNSEILYEVGTLADLAQLPAAERDQSLGLLFEESFSKVREEVFRVSHRFSPASIVTLPQEPSRAARLSGTASERSIFNSDFAVLEASCAEMFGMDVESLPLLILRPSLEAYVLYSFVSRPIPEVNEHNPLEESSKTLLETIHQEANLVGSEITQMVTGLIKFVEKLRVALISLENSYPQFIDKIGRLNERMEALDRMIQARASAMTTNRTAASLTDLRRRFRYSRQPYSPSSRSPTRTQADPRESRPSSVSVKPPPTSTENSPTTWRNVPPKAPAASPKKTQPSAKKVPPSPAKKQAPSPRAQNFWDALDQDLPEL